MVTLPKADPSICQSAAQNYQDAPSDEPSHPASWKHYAYKYMGAGKCNVSLCETDVGDDTTFQGDDSDEYVGSLGECIHQFANDVRSSEAIPETTPVEFAGNGLIDGHMVCLTKKEWISWSVYSSDKMCSMEQASRVIAAFKPRPLHMRDIYNIQPRADKRIGISAADYTVLRRTRTISYVLAIGTRLLQRLHDHNDGSPLSATSIGTVANRVLMLSDAINERHALNFTFETFPIR
jgi:hypothetical protein